jgi:hypothetical protein
MNVTKLKDIKLTKTPTTFRVASRKIAFFKSKYPSLFVPNLFRNENQLTRRIVLLTSNERFGDPKIIVQPNTYPLAMHLHLVSK